MISGYGRPKRLCLAAHLTAVEHDRHLAATAAARQSLRLVKVLGQGKREADAAALVLNYIMVYLRLL